MQMSMNDLKKVHVACWYIVLCVQIVERQDRNYFGLAVSALKLEREVWKVVLWLALFSSTTTVTNTFHMH